MYVVFNFRKLRYNTFISTVPEEFCYDPSSRTYGDPNRRPEIKTATVEFIAPSEYMVSFYQAASELSGDQQT